MQENKSIVEEALIQMRNVEEAIAQNAKGILASTMKEEISQLVKESLSEQEEDEVELDLDTEMDMDSDEEEMDMDVDNEDEDEIEMDLDASDDFDSEEPIDLTGASDDEILKIFKAMGEEDGIIVKKDGEDIHITDNNQDAEYLVKLGESEEMEESMDDELDEEDMELDMDSDMDSDMGSESDIDMIVNKLFDGDSHLEEDMDDMDDMDDEDMDDEEMDEIVYEIEMDDEMAEDDDIDPMGGMSIDVDSEMGEQSMDSELDIEMESEMYEEDEMEESYDHKKVGVKEAKMAMKPKGIGMGKPDFKYDGETEYKSPKKMKQGTKGVGMGKPKFEYKKGENMEGKAKKVETKEGQGYKDKEDEKLSMKHGKIASKKLDSTKSRRDDAKFEKEETKEAARTYGFGSKDGSRGLRKGITNNRNYVYGKGGVHTESVEEEVKQLREKNEEYRKALNIFRSKLNEVAIFNSNLAYATRLFTEHSTTKKEKINILRRFDGVESLKESKNLYKTLKDELGHVETPSKSINESVGKIDKVVTTGSSATLMENKTYEAPQFLRIKDLMSKIG
jgi:hypothetical protein